MFQICIVDPSNEEDYLDNTCISITEIREFADRYCPRRGLPKKVKKVRVNEQSSTSTTTERVSNTEEEEEDYDGAELQSVLETAQQFNNRTTISRF